MLLSLFKSVISREIIFDARKYVRVNVTETVLNFQNQTLIRCGWRARHASGATVFPSHHTLDKNCIRQNDIMGRLFLILFALCCNFFALVQSDVVSSLS